MAARSSPSPASSTGCARSTGCWPGSPECSGLKFLGYNALGAVLWVGTWCGLGYLAGENIVEIYDTFERYKWYVIGALAVVAAIVITRRVRRRRAERTA
jgi:membrane protein DedA with SNARE-associated domain